MQELEEVRLRGASFPAIAIPVEKKSVFECPQAHLNKLAALLPAVTEPS